MPKIGNHAHDLRPGAVVTGAVARLLRAAAAAVAALVPRRLRRVAEKIEDRRYDGPLETRLPIPRLDESPIHGLRHLLDELAARVR